MSFLDFLFPNLRPQFSKNHFYKKPTHKTTIENLQISINSKSWNVEIIRKTRRRTLSLEIKRDGKIIVRTNASLPQNDILKFLDSKQSWLIRQIKKIQERSTRNFFQPNENGQILMLGGNYALTAAEIENFSEKYFYLKHAKKYLPNIVRSISSKMQLSPKIVTCRHMRSRWGSCTSTGKVTLNSRLMAAPEWVIESVIVHELSHLTHMNHSKDFWELVNEFAPRHKEADLWLKKFLYIR